MSESTYKGLKQAHRLAKARRRVVAYDDYNYGNARALALQHGLDLSQCDPTHYRLRKPNGWLLEIYPGNLRLYRPKNRQPMAPHLDLPEFWGLDDVVTAAVNAERESEAPNEQ